jgi:hypothetical protein
VSRSCPCVVDRSEPGHGAQTHTSTGGGGEHLSSTHPCHRLAAAGNTCHRHTLVIDLRRRGRRLALHRLLPAHGSSKASKTLPPAIKPRTLHCLHPRHFTWNPAAAGPGLHGWIPCGLQQFTTVYSSLLHGWITPLDGIQPYIQRAAGPGLHGWITWLDTVVSAMYFTRYTAIYKVSSHAT